MASKGGRAKNPASGTRPRTKAEKKPAGKEPRAILLPYQRRWINDRSASKIWLKSRQVGASFTFALEAVDEALTRPCDNLIGSGSERQAKENVRKAQKHLRYLKVRSYDVIHTERESKSEIVFPNGSRIISIPSNPDTTRGFSGNVWLDEYAFHKDSWEIWTALAPSVTWGYKIRIASTPQGKQNMFYDIWQHDETFSKHLTDIYLAVKEGLPVDIEKLKKQIRDADTWAQEYECQFLDEATAWIPYDLINSCEDLHATAALEIDMDPAHEFYLGVDIGRKRDLTIFWINEKLGDVHWTRGVIKLEKTPFRIQREELYAILPHVRRACIDSTGIGAQLAEEARERFGSKVEEVTFTGAVKEDLAVTARRKFEDRQVRIPLDRDIREDVHSIKKFTTAAGNTRFDAERTELGHADRFWALALAIHAGSGAPVVMEYESPRQYREHTRLDGYFA